METIHLIQVMNVNPRFWLDTGCGTGTFINRALPLFQDTQFIMADLSDTMLELAKGKLAGYKRVKFLDPIASQDLNLDLEFDVITSIQAHHYLAPEIRRKATRVCFDLLSENGVYITFENIRPFSDQGIAISLANWSKFQRATGRDAETIENHMKRFDSEYFPITIESHLKLLRECGFRTVELFWLSYMQAGFYGIK